MKKHLQLLLCVVLALCLTCCTVLAEPRYPAQQDTVTDAAAVLSADTARDLKEAADRLAKATDVHLTIALVDFLDGSTITAYGEGLRTHWQLGNDDVLLLLAVGEDQFGLYGGRNFNNKISVSTQQKLLTSYLQTPFMAQDYDGALRAFVPALITECSKAFGESINLSGLLGTPETTAEPFDVESWLQRRFEQSNQTNTAHRVTDEDEDTGVSLGKIILTLFLLSVIFGKRNRRGRRHGRHGCGCMPFSSLLAALGLWKLWDRD